MFWKEWLQILLALAILAGVGELLLPSGDLGRFSRLVLGLVLMLAVLQPLLFVLDRSWEGIELGWQKNPDWEREWQNLAAKIQAAGESPFLRNADQGATKQLETLLLTLEQVTEVVVGIEMASAKINGVTVQLDSSDDGIKSKARKIAASFLNVREDLISVQELRN